MTSRYDYKKRYGTLYSKYKMLLAFVGVERSRDVHKFLAQILLAMYLCM